MSDTKPDLDAIEARANAATGKQWRVVDCDYVVSGNQNVAQTLWALADAEFIAHAREDVPALVAYARTLEAALDGRGVVLRDAYNDATRTRDAHIRRALAAEADRDLLRDTLTRRSAAHDRLVTRLDQVREWADRAERGGVMVVGLRDVLDGDQTEEAP